MMAKCSTPTFLAQHGHEFINPALPDEDFEGAVRIAQAEFDRHQPDVVIGSSRGGAVAMNINSGETRPPLPGLQTMGNSQNGENRHRDPAPPSR